MNTKRISRTLISISLIAILIMAGPAAAFATGTADSAGVKTADESTAITLDELKDPYFRTFHIIIDPEKAPFYVMIGTDNKVIPRSGYYTEDHVGGFYYDDTQTYNVRYISPTAFGDVPGWAKDAVDYISARGVVKGLADNVFGSNQNITRQDFVTMLIKAMNGDNIKEFPAAGNKFADDSNIRDYAKDAVYAAKALGITTGDTKNKFNPAAPVTRQEMFTFIYRAMDVFGVLPGGIMSKVTTVDQAFSDFDKVHNYAKEPIKALYNLDIVKGSGGKLTPTVNSTRAQAAQILANILEFEYLEYHLPVE